MNSADRGTRTGVLVACVWLVVLVLVDLAVRSPSVNFSPLYALAPLSACAVLPAAMTATFAAAALGLTAASHAWNEQWGEPQMWVRLLDVALVGAAAVAIAEVRVRREARLARVERIAEVAQRTILPLIPARVGSVSAAARYLSAAEDTLVGGDFYDWFHSERRTCFLVGDVRGKGVGAVEQAARVIRAFRQSAAAGEDLATIAGQMSAYLVPFFDDEEFATAALLEVGTNGQVTLVDCGHPAPLLVPHRGMAGFVEAPVCLPLGLGTTYEATSVSWSPGDRLLLYTDGLSEARDGHDEYLPVAELTPVLGERAIEDALDAVLDQVREHVPDGRLADDLAVLLLENTGVEPPRRRDARDHLAFEASARRLEATW
ncbi:PP2C family protein-serine/threonine phosphatase [Knoellia sp. p5-6-4]|uniref:PP2C family protein-serine/threonine phosphatase n=1 Tax=unclassified Knoellia TaxID=2618719 RepID=UPI0023DCD402|nr:PP2C family protein-serine/threonine phosphatase [Knoellia sp. p5-6-4]MDF2143720.1 PP2C family protein-serine/threonine phosphatase [Knoellia sp. p5-6-4]